jgi:hypothetical protein
MLALAVLSLAKGRGIIDISGATVAYLPLQLA